MKTEEYFSRLDSLEKDAHPEFHTFLTVWVKSRMPDTYKELLSDYKNNESEIFAKHECDTNKTEMPF
tara:strand:- start:270 stop:470 length:201 start_codon:yes stop_codon:yes gene_type:complete